MRFNASVAWTSFEIAVRRAPATAPGSTFEDADPVAVDAFCATAQSS